MLIPLALLTLAFSVASQGPETESTEEWAWQFEEADRIRASLGIPPLIPKERMEILLGNRLLLCPFVVSVGRYGSMTASIRWGSISLRFPIYSVKIYRAVPRQSDGVTTRRLFRTVGTPRACQHEPSQKLIDEGEAIAEQMGLPFDLDIRHGQEAFA
jgi:hypothetical protein